MVRFAGGVCRKLGGCVDELKQVAQKLRRLPVVDPSLPVVTPTKQEYPHIPLSASLHACLCADPHSHSLNHALTYSLIHYLAHMLTWLAVAPCHNCLLT